MQPGVEKETLLPFSICSIKSLDYSAVVLLLSVGFGKNNLNILSSATTHLYKERFSPRKNKLHKSIYKNKEPCRDRIPKKQPNKVEMTPQYFYGLPSLHLLPFFQPYLMVLITWHDRKLVVQCNCDVYILWHLFESACNYNHKWLRFRQ